MRFLLCIAEAAAAATGAWPTTAGREAQIRLGLVWDFIAFSQSITSNFSLECLCHLRGRLLHFPNQSRLSIPAFCLTLQNSLGGVFEEKTHSSCLQPVAFCPFQTGLCTLWGTGDLKLLKEQGEVTWQPGKLLLITQGSQKIRRWVCTVSCGWVLSSDRNRNRRFRQNRWPEHTFKGWRAFYRCHWLRKWALEQVPCLRGVSDHLFSLLPTIDTVFSDGLRTLYLTLPWTPQSLLRPHTKQESLATVGCILSFTSLYLRLSQILNPICLTFIFFFRSCQWCPPIGWQCLK